MDMLHVKRKSVFYFWVFFVNTTRWQLYPTCPEKERASTVNYSARCFQNACGNSSKQTRGNIYQKTYHLTILLNSNKELVAALNCLNFRFLQLSHQCEQERQCFALLLHLNDVHAGAYGGGIEEKGSCLSLKLISTFSCTHAALHIVNLLR